MTDSAVLQALRAEADPSIVPGKAQYHKTKREMLGASNPVINAVVAEFRRTHDMAACLSEARMLWTSGIFEARIAAPKLLIKARIKPPELEAEIWDQVVAWLPDLDGWAIADHLADAGNRRVMADLSRLDQIEEWTRSDHLWTKRAALVMTLPLAKQRHPSAAEAAGRARVLGWAADYTADPEWFIQKAVSWWLRTLGDREPEVVRAFVAEHGPQMKGFARKDALRKIGG